MKVQKCLGNIRNLIETFPLLLAFTFLPASSHFLTEEWHNFLNFYNFPHSWIYASALKFPWMPLSHAILNGGKNFSEYKKQIIWKNYVPAKFHAQNPILEPEKKRKTKIFHNFQFAKIFQLIRFGLSQCPRVYAEFFLHLNYKIKFELWKSR